MQNVAQASSSDNQKLEKVNVHHDLGKSSTPVSSNSSPTKSETETYSELQPRFMSDSSESEEDDVSEVESFEINQADLDEETRLATSKFLLTPDPEEADGAVDPETQARLEALLEAAGIGKLSTGDGKHLADPEVLRRLTSSVSCALDEAAAALTRMRTENPRPQTETRSLVEACSDGDVGTVKKLLTEGRSVHETTEEGESLLSLACSAGYYELGQVLLAMHANVEDRGIKGDCTPLMEAASAGHVDIVRLLIIHSADVNAQSSSGNTPLMYACAGGHEEVVKILLESAANVEDHNENGHTPLMEAASAGHVGVAKILLDNGAGINTHSNEFKESALTLACYKGHLDMVRFLLQRGADQEHKTDEMHTALMEASMDGHVEVARLLLDSGAQVNMPTDSFESPLTLAACGGHVDLAMLLIERGANIEEVNDEGYTPLMEAAREGHEEMVALLLSQGANINAQTEETQETALTLACCGGFTDVADFLIKAGADIELGASTPLMEAAQEGHLELVKYLLEASADVHAQTQTGDTALTYACENGHTDVADLLLQYGADLEHESEGGRTPLMKACRAGHLCTVQFLVSKHADVNRQTTNNDHTPLSLACAGGHLGVVELLLAQTADPFHKLKDNSTMLIEAAKGGHTSVVQLLLDYPHSIMMTPPHPHAAPGGLDQVPDAVRAAPDDLQAKSRLPDLVQQKHNTQKSLLRKSRSASTVPENNLTSAEVQQTRNQPFGDNTNAVSKDETNILDKGSTVDTTEEKQQCREEHILQKQQILEELQRVERELQEKGPGQLLVAAESGNPPTLGLGTTVSTATLLPAVPPIGINIELGSQGQLCGTGMPGTLFGQGTSNSISIHNSFFTGKGQEQVQVAATTVSNSCLQQNNTEVPEGFLPVVGIHPPLPTVPCPQPPQPPQPPQVPADVVQATPLEDRPKAKPVSKKEGKNLRKQQAYQAALQQQKLNQQTGPLFHQVSPFVPKMQPPLEQDQNGVTKPNVTPLISPNQLMAQLHQMDVTTSAPVTTSQLNQMLQQKSAQLRTLQQQMLPPGGSLEAADLTALLSEQQQRCQLFAAAAEEALAEADKPQAESEPAATKVEYFAVTPSGAQIPVQQVPPGSALHLQYQQYQLSGGLQVSATSGISIQSGTVQFQASSALEGIQAPLQTSQILRDPRLTTLQTVAGSPFQSSQLILQTPQLAFPSPMLATSDASSNTPTVGSPCSAHQPPGPPPCTAHQVPPICTAHQVQVATQTTALDKKCAASPGPAPGGGKKKARFQLQPRQAGSSPLYPAPQQNSTAPLNFQTEPSAGPGYAGAQTPYSCMDVDSETDSNHDTALTLACAGGHEELVDLLLTRGADIEHRDKKGFTPLILAATAGHEKVVEILLNHGADIEAQSERTKDTPLSLACSGGRYEVVELLLQRCSNKEHRNVSDYTPLSLAASGGYVNIIKLLLAHGAEINSRTGSKLGISPLMLAAMNGHTAAVKLLLDMGSDINAQIETNRNTALTLACFQGRHEVVSLLLDRKANVEHRAKTGLTPLMEAASGGYVEVGRVLLDKGADVNAPPVPSSRDTALTIAADKGHCRFVELLLTRGAQVEVKNKKGNSPLWLAANGGHLTVVELLYNAGADIDSQDNRKVSCLMAAFRKGHMKVVKWMVHAVTQFPSDQEMTRYIATVSDKDLLEKCQDCVRIIRAAKDQQAAKANKNASILLEELDMEKTREESKKAAAARRRERKKKKKLEKKEEKRKLHEENKKNETICDDNDDDENRSDDEEPEIVEENEVTEVQSIETTPEVNSPARNIETIDKEEGDSGIDANSQGSCSSGDVKSKERRKDKKKKKSVTVGCGGAGSSKENSPPIVSEPEMVPIRVPVPSKMVDITPLSEPKERREPSYGQEKLNSRVAHDRKLKGHLVFEASRPHPAEREDFEATGNETYIPAPKGKKNSYIHYCDADLSTSSSNKTLMSSTSPKQGGKREEGWKEVVRKYLNSPFKSKKVSVPLNAISRVIGRGGSNINAIRGATGAHIEVEKQSKGQGERIITIKGSAEATRQAHTLIAALIKDPEVDILQMLPKSAKVSLVSVSSWDKSSTASKSKTLSSKTSSIVSIQPTSLLGAGPTSLLAKPVTGVVGVPVPLLTSLCPSAAAKLGGPPPVTRGTAPRLVAAAEKRAAAQLAASSNTKTTMSYTSAIMTDGRPTKLPSSAASQTFAAKLTDHLPQPSLAVTKSRLPQQAVPTSLSPKHHRPLPPASAPPSIPGQYQLKAPFSQPPSSQTTTSASAPVPPPTSVPLTVTRSTTPKQDPPQQSVRTNTSATPQEYSLFNDNFTKVTQQSMWGRENDLAQKGMNFASVAATGATAPGPPTTATKFLDNGPMQVDAAKAPGYRGTTMSSPVSSKSSTTPPSLPPYQSSVTFSAEQCLPTSAGAPKQQADVPPFNTHQMYPSDHGQPLLKMVPEQQQHPILANFHQQQQHHHQHHPSPLNFSQTQPTQQSATNTTVSMSRLNPRAPDFSLHVSNKPNMFTPAPPFHQRPPPPPPQNNPNLLPNMTFKSNLNPYHPSNAPSSNIVPNGQRWPMFTHPFHSSHHPDMVGQINYPTSMAHLAALSSGLNHPTNDLLASLENGGSPAMSPNNVPSEMHHHKIEDRKIMPIGTERASWKSYGGGGCGDPDPTNWMLGGNEPKMSVSSWTGGGGQAGDRHQVYRQNHNQFGRIPPADDLCHMIDTTFQSGHLDSQNSFHNGNNTAATLSLMHHGLQLMQPHFSSGGADVGPPDSVKMDVPNWDGTPRLNMPDPVQEKQHGWAAKWSH